MAHTKKVIRKASYGKIVINLIELGEARYSYMLEVVSIGTCSSMCFFDDEFKAEAVFRNTASFHRITRGKKIYSGIRQYKLECEVGEMLDEEAIQNQYRHVEKIQAKLDSGELVEFEDPYRDDYFIVGTPEERDALYAEAAA